MNIEIYPSEYNIIISALRKCSNNQYETQQTREIAQLTRDNIVRQWRQNHLTVGELLQVLNCIGVNTNVNTADDSDAGLKELVSNIDIWSEEFFGRFTDERDSDTD